MSLLRTWVAVAAVAGLMTEGALAADLAVKAVKAPPPVAGYDWNGFYVGGHFGYTMGIDQTSAPVQSDFIGSRGITGGLLGGYNYMVAPRILLGVEGDVSWTTNAHSDSISEGPYVETIKFGQGTAYSARGRAGYLVTPETLLYGTAGWSWTDYRLIEGVSGLGVGSLGAHFNGVQAGGGVETKLDAHFSARVEYLVTLYNSQTFFAGEPFGIKPSTSVGRAALIYNFGGGAPAQAFAPEPVPMPSWNGFYLGAELGVGVANARVSFNNTTPNAFDGFGFPAVGPTALIGYDWRVAPRWVLGAEGEIAPGYSTNEFKLDFLSAVRGKLGYLWTPSTMLYGTVGWTATRVGSTTITNSPVTIATQNVNGVEVGGGIETAITNHWLARFEYHYAQMAKVNNVGISESGFPGGTASITPTYQNMHLGVSYLFDGH